MENRKRMFHVCGKAMSELMKMPNASASMKKDHENILALIRALDKDYNYPLTTTGLVLANALMSLHVRHSAKYKHSKNAALIVRQYLPTLEQFQVGLEAAVPGKAVSVDIVIMFCFSR